MAFDHNQSAVDVLTQVFRGDTRWSVGTDDEKPPTHNGTECCGLFDIAQMQLQQGEVWKNPDKLTRIVDNKQLAESLTDQQSLGIGKTGVARDRLHPARHQISNCRLHVPSHPGATFTIRSSPAQEHLHHSVVSEPYAVAGTMSLTE